MPPTEAERQAIARYQAANIRQLKFKLNVRTDQDILQHLESVSNFQGYIKSLIRADMARASKTDKD